MVVSPGLTSPAFTADPKPVGTGPFVLDKFSPQGFSMKENPFYWNKSKLHVPEVDFPSYTSNANLVPPVASGQIDWAGNQIPGIQANYLAKSPDNHTGPSCPPRARAATSPRPPHQAACCCPATTPS